jgi:hypothetical protein
MMIPDPTENADATVDPSDECRSQLPTGQHSIEANSAQAARATNGLSSLNRNMQWWSAHGEALIPELKEKFIAVAGEELFVADSRCRVQQLASEAHPEDEGVFVLDLTSSFFPRLYAVRRQLGAIWKQPSTSHDRSVSVGN